MIKDEEQSWKSFFIETAILIAIVIFIRFYIFQLFRVSGPSMCPTLNILNDECEYDKGEFIFVNEFSYNFLRNPKRGEIVVFEPPSGKSFYIKRVIGVPGDTIEIENGKVYLTNDKHKKFELPEKYLSPRNQGRTQAQRKKFIVPEGKYLMFGDNRNQSLDARQCFGSCKLDSDAFIPKSEIKGRAEFVLWPYWTARMLHKNPLKDL